MYTHTNLTQVIKSSTILLTLGFALIAGQHGYAESESAGGSQLIYGETTKVDSLDPYTSHDAAGQRLSDLIFDSLIETKAGGSYAPSLASSWQVNDGNTAITFKLRSDAVWHAQAGEAHNISFSADDVVATVRLLLAETSDIPNRERFLAIKEAEKIDNLTVTLRFARSLSDPLRYAVFKILPAHVIGSAPSLRRDNILSKNPIGTGPYVFSKATTQGEVLLTANPRYFKGAPEVKRMVMKSYADQSVMTQSLMYESLDLVTYVGPRDLPEVQGDVKLNVLPYDALSFSFFAMNTSRPALQDKRVRQALNYAVNRAEMLKAFFQGKGRLISGPFPPTSWAYNLDVQPSSFDSKRAKDLLSACGYIDRNQDGLLENAQNKPLQFKFLVPVSGESEMIKRLALAYQGYLQAVGVKVELQFLDWLVWKKKVLGEHDYDITIASWSFDDASNITSLFHSSSAKPWGNNFVLYRNVEVDALLTEADTTNDVDKRRAIYHKLHAMLADDMPYTYLWTLTHHAAHHNRIAGVTIEPFQFFKNVATWQVKKDDKL